MNKYEKPYISVKDIELEGFICASIHNLPLGPEVDQTENMGTEDLILD